MKKTLVIIVSAVLAILLVLAVLFVARGRSVGVTSSVDKRKILIGQAIHYSLVVRAPEGTETELPDMEAALKAFDIRDKRSSEEMSFGSRVIRKEYLLTLFNSGEFSIPSVTVKYRTGEGGAWKEIATRQIKINVKSLLPKDFKTEVPKVRIVGGELSDDSFGGAGIKAVGGRGREVEGLIRFPIKEDKKPRNIIKVEKYFKRIGVLLGVLLIVLLIALATIRIRRRERPQVYKPWELAEKDLQALKKMGLLDKGDHREFSTELSSIMLTYARAMFKMRSAQMTSSELTEEFSKIEGLGEEKKQYLIDLMTSCEQLKYTAYAPDEVSEVMDIGKALKFVEDTKPREE